MKDAFIGSVRRECWEHREIWIAPLTVAAFTLIAVLINAHNIKQKLVVFAAVSPDKQAAIAVMPFALTASAILLMSFCVGMFYAFDALSTERKDRSILFWKSMPVSDAMTVLSKAFIPAVVQPAVGFVIALVTWVLVALLLAAILATGSVDVGPLAARVPIATVTISLLYGVIVHVLWYAPLYAFALMMGAWLRRPALWTIMPLFVLPILEKIAFGTSFVIGLVKDRLIGAMQRAFVPLPDDAPVTALSQLDPGRFLSSPGLWIGLAFAAGFLHLAIHLRRSRELL